MTLKHTLLIRSNRLALWVELTVLALLALAMVPAVLFPKYDVGLVYPIIILMVPLAALFGLVTGIAAAGFYLAGRVEPFWETAAPLNLAFVCLFMAFASIPPPPAMVGATGSAILALVCAVALLRKNGPPRKVGLPLVLALPLAGVLPPLACWAPLSAAIVFIGVWAAVRFEWMGSAFPE